MKKKTIIGIIIASIIIVAGGSYAIYASVHNKNLFENNIQNKLESPTVKEVGHKVKSIDKDKNEKATVVDNNLNKNIIKSRQVQYKELGSTIQNLDKENTDNNRWWGSSLKEQIDKLSREAKKYNDKTIQSIVDNSSKIPSYLIQLAVMHPESIPYTAGYVDKKQNQPINIDSYYKKGEIPLFQQWDKQWGYDWYGNGPIAMDGCGPTSLAMVVVGLTGDTSINPRVVADYSAKHGGYSWNQGSNGTLMTSVARHFGLDANEISSSQVMESLRSGHPVIVSLGPGEFTLTGHIIVLAGLDKDGKIIMNNPDSIVDSNKTWTLSQITASAKAFYSYKKA